MTREEKVLQFRKAAGQEGYLDDPAQFHLVLSCIEEEKKEFHDAVFNFAIDPCEKTREELCKEWADLQYVVSQAAAFFDIPADPAFNRVHASNMSKLVDGKIIRRDDGKILKPSTYEEPDMRGL